MDSMKALVDVVILLFAVSCLSSVGMQLTLSQIVAPLRDPIVVLTSLIANFIAAPLLAIAVCRIFSLEESHATGLILLGAAAGAPFLPKLVRPTPEELGLATSLMVLLMVCSMIYLPLIQPLLLPGATVNSAKIAKSLLLTMIAPLAAGLVFKAKFPAATRFLLPLLTRLSNLTLVIALILIPAMNVTEFWATIRARGLVAGIVFVMSAFAAGYLLPPKSSSRAVLGFATAARNIPAALIIAAQNFSSAVTTMVVVVAMSSLLVFVPAMIGIQWNSRSPSST